MRLVFNNRQHSVGHGFFHSATIKIKDEKRRKEQRFHYVYDCGGSKKGLDQEVKNYLRMDLRDDPLDAIFVSHLHRDHVSGFGRLLKKRRAKYVFLPYLTPVERLIIAAQMIGEGIGFNQELTLFPVRWFSKRADKVIQVSKGQGGGEFPFPEDPPPSPDRPIDFGKTLKYQTIHQSSHETIEAASQRIYPIEKMWDSDPVILPGLWLFALYVAKPRKNRLSEFVDELADELPSIGVPLLSKKVDEEEFYAKAQSILSNRKKRGKLAKCYGKVFGEKRLNGTSLCLCSSPLIQADWVPKDAPLKVVFPFGLVDRSTSKVSWLGTGDAELRKEKDIREFVYHYQSLLDHVHTVSLPHHGSIDNFHPGLVGATNPMEVFVTCPENSDHHPAPDVISRLRSVGISLKKVTDDGIGFHQVFEVHYGKASNS